MKEVVLITGASTGFGRILRPSCSRGAATGYLPQCAIRSAANAGAREDLQSLGSEVLELDVTDDLSVARAVSEALSRAGQIDEQYVNPTNK